MANSSKRVKYSYDFDITCEINLLHFLLTLNTKFNSIKIVYTAPSS